MPAPPKITNDVIERTAAQMRATMAEAGVRPPSQELMTRRVAEANRLNDLKQSR